MITNEKIAQVREWLKDQDQSRPLYALLERASMKFFDGQVRVCELKEILMKGQG